MAKKHMKRCQTSPIIIEMQIKTELRYHLTSIRLATNETDKQNMSVCNDMEKLELCALLVKMVKIGENVKWYSHYGKLMFPQVIKDRITI